MIKDIIKYILIYGIIVSILFGTLVLTSMIPKKLILENLKESAEFLGNKLGIQTTRFETGFESLHYHADSMLLNIMYFTDENKPAQSIMEAKYYKAFWFDNTIDFVNAIAKDKEANEEYIRYWHGSLSILRPLMTVFNIEQIYNINKAIFGILFIILTIILIKKYKALAISFFITSIMVTLYVTPYCLEYTWTVFIMMITSIISVLIEKKGNKSLYLLYFITGILTCYFDFLSTEILTILIPVLFVILIRYKENRIEKFKDGFKFLVVSGMLWLAGYSLMWLAKWIIASLILKINAYDFVKERAMYRVNWNLEKELNLKLYFETLEKNFERIKTLFKISKTTIVIVIAMLIAIFRILSWGLIKKEKRTKEFGIKTLLLIIAIIPYIRYCVLSNHSYNHCFFTYRSQLPSLISISFIVIYSLEKCIREKVVLILSNINVVIKKNVSKIKNKLVKTKS